MGQILVNLFQKVQRKETLEKLLHLKKILHLRHESSILSG